MERGYVPRERGKTAKGARALDGFRLVTPYVIDYNLFVTWAVRQIDISGKRASLLIEDGFRDSAPVAELPWLTWFGVYCRLDPEGAYLHPEETEALDRIESDLIGLCDVFGHGWVVYVLRIDTPGIREYYLYRGKHAALENVLPSLKNAHPDYKIEFDEKYDADWERYLGFVRA